MMNAVILKFVYEGLTSGCIKLRSKGRGYKDLEHFQGVDTEKFKNTKEYRRTAKNRSSSIHS